MLKMTQKQAENWRNTIRQHHRWNLSTGATRSGKTYLDYHKIPMRIRRAPEAGLIFIIGNTQATLERNIIEPMRQIWTTALVGTVRANNEIQLFGRKAYAIGADKISQVDRIRGASLAYAYGDEVGSWHPEVFEMLKSRLDQPGACFDGTANPEAPTHWLKRFIDNPDIDLYHQQYSIDDNPTLPPDFVKALKTEYAGTVLYDRYIEGNWVAAEGSIYPTFAADPERYIESERIPPEKARFVSIGVDFGGNRSAHAFEATAFSKDLKRIQTIAERYIHKIITPEELDQAFIDFIRYILKLGYKIGDIRADSAETVLIAGLNQALNRAALPYMVLGAIKGPIMERIKLYNRLINRGAYTVHASAEMLIKALSTAVYDPAAKSDTRLDNGIQIIDPLDAQEYSTEPFAEILLYGGDAA